MITQTLEREELQRVVNILPDDGVATILEFVRSLYPDPFYTESNMKHLLAVKADAQVGLNMSVHDLIEVDDD